MQMVKRRILVGRLPGPARRVKSRDTPTGAADGLPVPLLVGQSIP
jgi:hypothetical protein